MRSFSSPGSTPVCGGFIFFPGWTYADNYSRSSWKKKPPHIGVDPGKLNERTHRWMAYNVIDCHLWWQTTELTRVRAAHNSQPMIALLTRARFIKDGGQYKGYIYIICHINIIYTQLSYFDFIYPVVEWMLIFRTNSRSCDLRCSTRDLSNPCHLPKADVMF